MKTKAQITISIFLIVGAAFGCKVRSHDKALTPVKIRAVETFAASGGARYSASIRPRTQVELAFKVGGYVDALHKVRGVDNHPRDVQEGDTIASGTVLARVR